MGRRRYTSLNVAITTTVLGAIAENKPRHFVVASSGAVHLSTGGLVSDLRSNLYGTPNHTDELAFRAGTQDAGGMRDPKGNSASPGPG